VLNGNNVYVPVQVPINLCGTAIGVIGGAVAGCEGGAATESAHLTENTAAESTGVLNGNNVYVPVQIPINVCGNAIGLLGGAAAGCQGGAATDPAGSGAGTAGGGTGLGNGNNIQVPIQIPVNVCGNAIGLLGPAIAGCQAPADPGDPVDPGYDVLPMVTESGSALSEVVPVDALGLDGVTSAVPLDSLTGAVPGLDSLTGGVPGMSLARSAVVTGGGCMESGRAESTGIANGNHIMLGISLPVNVSGNAVAVAGVAGATSKGGSTAAASC
jgi:hypothetical protein